jgi:hypothetical protein
MSIYKVGDRVFLRQNSQFYGELGQLPPNVIGTVNTIGVNLPFNVGVEWDDVKSMYDSNGYDDNDLELARKVSNKLSKRLYPTWIEKDGYLYSYDVDGSESTNKDVI